MRRAKVRAMAALFGCAAFMGIALGLSHEGINIPAWIAAVLGLVCGQDCYHYGVEWERERMYEMFEEDEELWGKANDQAVCGVCNCPEFYSIAGRMVCTCCGTVLENEQK